jgi:hypothetical protein
MVTKARRKAFDSIVILVVWGIWLERNARVFSNASVSAPAIVDTLWETCEQWVHARLIDQSQISVRE